MRENNDLTFAKSRILVGKANWRHGHTRLNDQSIGLLAINRNVFGTAMEIFGRLRKSSDIFGYYRSPTKNLDTLRIKIKYLQIEHHPILLHQSLMQLNFFKRHSTPLNSHRNSTMLSGTEWKC